ncbi:MAG: nicotinate-nucleotide--dimethylbenzimidazole phosphoribosyltransferase [Eubacteriales bacterium]|nr:nicotinate-nucleotide--dimethylbenzimidazole phosphoribosyltransferase [Eubacteriales bacterium]
MTLEEAVKNITELDEGAMKECQKRWDSIAKPLHSLGKLEDFLVKIAGMTGTSHIDLSKKALVEMCADNGVVEEGVTQTGQEITALVTENFSKMQSTASVMCHKLGADLIPVDIGVAVDTSAWNRKVAYGTKNMTKGPAMTREEAVKALEVGINLVGELKEKGYRILATGEMGIGNTTTSSAMAAVFLDVPAEQVTGKGAGLSSEGLLRKIDAIKRAIERNRPDKNDAVDVLSKVGGLDLAGITGMFLGGAFYKIPIVIDGFISAVAALTAKRICKESVLYMIPSHISKEPAGSLILDELGLEAPLHCDMCLGEGTGAAVLFPILDLADTVYNTMSTFQDIKMEEYKPLS